jgi:hypothetical protein
MKLKTIIFSFNRPAQLSLLLSSIKTFDLGSNFDVTVLYTYNDEKIKQGYNKVKSMFSNHDFIEEARFKTEKTNSPFIGNLFYNSLLWLKNKRFRHSKSNFRQILLSLLNDDDYKYVMFLTDDSLFYNTIEIDKNILSRINDYNGDAYSLALGKNIEGAEIEYENDIPFTSTQKKSDNVWYYPFSVDGRIYATKFIYSLSKKLLFSNPNTYESIMVNYNNYFKKFNTIYVNHNSSLVGFELNRVQNIYNNNHIDIDYKIINDYFIDDFKLKIDFNTAVVSSFRPSVKDVLMIKDSEEISIINKKP